MISFWDKDFYFNFPDVTIVGAGFTGLQTALYLKKKNPELHVIVVDRDHLSSGASNRNAGFACFGSPSELIDDLTREPFAQVIERVASRYEGLLLLRKNIGNEDVDWKNTDGYELFRKADMGLFEACQEKLVDLNDAIQEKLGFSPYTEISPDTFPFRNFQRIIKIKNEGQLNPVKVLNALKKSCMNAGIPVIYGIDVKGFLTDNQSVEINSSAFSWTSRVVILATNSFSEQLIPNLNIVPARGQVLITRPLPNLQWQGTFHADQGYYYFRNVGNRILLGGARNSDMNNEFINENELNHHIQQNLETFINEHIANVDSIEIEHRWTGIMAFGKHHEKEPLVYEAAPRIILAARLGGMGVALSAIIAERASDLALSKIL